MGDAAGAPMVIPTGEHGDDQDHDSALGDDDTQSDTTSLASTIFRHREENGRTYHKLRAGENEYWCPNDEQQNDQLDIGHHMLTMLLHNRLYLAPLDPSQPTSALDRSSTPFRVLDVGCGTGIWAMDFAGAWPNAEVHGIDLSPIQPIWVPPNMFFSIDDVESEWTFPDNHFDFVHIRCLMGSIGDWPALYREAYKHMTPGGWIQHLDMDISFVSDDGTVGDDHVMAQWSNTFTEAGERIGKTFDIPNRMPALMEGAGFEDLQQVWYKVPVGGWTKDKLMKQVGQWNYYYCLQGCEGWALFLLTKVLLWKLEEVQVFIAKFKAALNDKKNHAYYKIGVVWARKPVTRL